MKGFIITKNVLFLGGYNFQGHILETKKMRKHVIFFHLKIFKIVKNVKQKC